MDDTLDLIKGLRLLNSHLWGDGEPCIADTFELVKIQNRLNAFLGRVEELKSPGRFRQWDFWRFVCCRLREDVRGIIKAINRLSYTFLPVSLRLLFLCFFTCFLASICAATATQGWQRFATTHPPPKVFVPIPKSEIGGCARSDSTVPAI